MTAKWEVIEVGDRGLAAYVGAPEGAGPHPGVVVIQHAAGVDAVIQDTVRRLADAGFAAIAPDMFAHQDVNVGLSHEERQGRMRDAIAIKDVNATVAYLREHCDTAGQGIGIMGFCLGGRVTYMMAAVNSEFRRRGGLLRGQCAEALGRRALAVRADRRHLVSAAGAVRAGGHEPVAGGRGQVRRGADAAGQAARVPRLRWRGTYLYELQRTGLPGGGG